MRFGRVDTYACTFGTDPEYFVLNSKGEPVPAHTVGFPSAKHKIRLLSDDSKVFRDGYAVELNIAPSTCRQTLTFRMQRALQSVASRLKPGYTLATLPAVKINLKQMEKAPSDVREFGCNPSRCAYTGAVKVPPIDAMSHEWRYSGAHLHFSPTSLYDGPDDECYYVPETLTNPETYPGTIKLLDVYLGLPLTCMFHRPELYQRRRFYGQAGEYREQQYPYHVRGLEYRTPGPELWNLPWLASLALSIGRYVVNNRAVLALHYDKHYGEAVRNAIDTGEDRWKLLRTLPLTPYTPALWRLLYLHRPYEATPYTLIRSTSTSIVYGFRQWFEKHGKKPPKKGRVTPSVA